MAFLPLLFLLALMSAPVPYYAQLWSGILDPSRATNWSGAGVQGGIPTYSTICETVNPSGDTTGGTDGAAINNAFSTCAASASSSSPRVVLLAAGTYYSKIGIGPPLGSSYLVLRGAGPDKTIIKFLGTSGQCGRSSGVDLCVAGNTNNDGFYAGTTAWLGTNGTIGTYTQAASVLDVSSTTGLAAGEAINLDQRNDSVGLCPQSGGTGNCNGVVGLTNNGLGIVKAVTSIPDPAIVAGKEVYVGTITNHSLDGSGGGYQSGPTPWTVLSASTTSTNTTFTYTDLNALSAPTQAMYAAVDNGGVFTCDINASCQLANSFAGRTCPDSRAGNQCQPGEVSLRSQNEVHTINAICTGAGTPLAACKAANEVVIDGQVIAPNYRSSQSPGVWWTGNSLSKYSQYVGIEGLTLDDTNDPASPFATISLLNTINCWVKNVRSINTYGIHIDLEVSNHDSVVDTYMFGTKHEGTQSYGIDFDADTTNDLAQNNITQHVVSGIQDEQSYGNVIAYNYLVDSSFGVNNSIVAMTDLNHGFAGANLMEGTDTNQCDSDGAHGTSWGLTFFRNRCRGQDTPVNVQTDVAVTDPGFQRAQNFVGNVLGTPPYQTTYVQNTQIPFFPNEGIYWLNTSAGYIENGSGGNVPLALDSVVTATLLRWGNYDVVTGAVRWCGNSSDTAWSTICSLTSEIPTTGIPFINGNPVPTAGDTGAGQPNLPRSFYLSSQPIFWQTAFGTPPFPPIGPDVTGGTAPDGAGGHAYAIPSQLCYENTAIDPSYQQTFSITGVTSHSSSSVTLTTSTNAVKAKDTIAVSGVNPSSYNGTWSVTAATSTSVTYAVQSDPGTYVSGGTVAWPNILQYNAAKCYTAEYGPIPDQATTLTVTKVQ